MSRSPALTLSPARSFALDVAAPALRADPDAPWTGAPAAHGEAGLAAAFWVAFHGLSVFVHAVLVTASVAGPVLLALVPIPFVAALCSDVRPVPKPPERVEMAIVELPPPPEPPVVEPPVVEPVDAAPKVAPVKVAKARSKKLKDVESAGMIALLGSMESDGQLASVFGRDDALDGAVLGVLVGSSIGDSYGAGGLGLVGTGAGGGGTGEGTIGLGTIGTIGRGGGTGSGYGRGMGGLGGGARVTVTLDGVDAAERKRLGRMLSGCRIEETVSGTVVVSEGRAVSASTTPTNACVARVVRRASFSEDGTHPFTVAPIGG